MISGPASVAPYPGFDPLDGDEPRIALSRDNPCKAHDSRPFEPSIEQLRSVSQAEAEMRGWA